jgi:hypothetical protein
VTYDVFVDTPVESIDETQPEVDEEGNPIPV